MKDLILIIGKGSISFKHYKILKKIYKKKKNFTYKFKILLF